MQYWISLLALIALAPAGFAFDARVPAAKGLVQQIGGPRPHAKGAPNRNDRGEVTAPLPPTAADPSTGDAAMQDDDLTQIFKGNSSFGFMIDDSGPFREYYAPNGDIGGYKDTGHWSVKDGALCARYKGKKEWCYAVRPLPDGAYRLEIDGRTEGYIKLVPGNYFEF